MSDTSVASKSVQTTKSHCSIIPVIQHYKLFTERCEILALLALL